MAQRKWRAGYGLLSSVRSGKEMHVDLVDDVGLTEDEAEELTKEEAQAEVLDYVQKKADDDLETWARPEESDAG